MESVTATREEVEHFLSIQQTYNFSFGHTCGRGTVNGSGFGYGSNCGSGEYNGSGYGRGCPCGGGEYNGSGSGSAYGYGVGVTTGRLLSPAAMALALAVAEGAFKCSMVILWIISTRFLPSSFK